MYQYIREISFFEVFFYTALILVMLLNRKDGHRLYLCSTLFIFTTLAIILKQFLPHNVVIVQLVYIGINITFILSITYRVAILKFIHKLSPRFSLVFENVRSGCASQEKVVKIIFKLSICLSALMIFEHLLRHPYYIGLSADYKIYSVSIYNSYSYIHNFLISLQTLCLLTMTIEGKKIRAMSAE